MSLLCQCRNGDVAFVVAQMESVSLCHAKKGTLDFVVKTIFLWQEISCFFCMRSQFYAGCVDEKFSKVFLLQKSLVTLLCW